MSTRHVLSRLYCESQFLLFKSLQFLLWVTILITHINDLPLELRSDVISTMFADDTTILVRWSSVTSLSTQLNEVATTVSTWADNNRMSLNTTKTKSLLTSTLQKRRNLTSSALNVQVDGRSTEQIDHAKMLGVTIDSDMSWEHHIDTICCIISSRLFRRIKPYLNFDSALRFYNSCVNNYFIYCSAAWGNCSHDISPLTTASSSEAWWANTPWCRPLSNFYFFIFET